MILVHVTHEAVERMGGIGTVIAGLITADAYADEISRTILLGPLLSTDRPVARRLGEGGRVIYSTLDAVEPSPWREKFRPIERTYDVNIVYGTRKVDEPCSGRQVEAEVVLIDVFHSNTDRLNLFKAELFRNFGVPSAEFEHIWEYEEYVRLAEPGFEAIRALTADGDDDQAVFLAHEYMGMATALKAVLAGRPRTRAVFYAHEVASVRPIVEGRPGHDTMFYNVLRTARQSGLTLEDVFPAVAKNFKHPLVKAARYCDGVFSVGDSVIEEMRFLDRYFKTMEIDLVYNGIPAMPLSLKDKRLSRDRMKQYAENLFGVRPDWIMTHVARPVVSKAIWRDIRVLHEMEPILAGRAERAVYFMLGTLAGQRRRRDILQMERRYGWPVTHEQGYPDLCQGEEVLGEVFDDFNRNHEAVRVAFVNQWDWSREVCGQRMPEDMTFADIRRGTDVEFGLSIYEPFGISQLEPLSFGAICVVSNVCGCLGFVRRACDGQAIDGHVIEADFLRLSGAGSLEELKNLPASRRDEIEMVEGNRLAHQMAERLPRDDDALERRIADGYELARKMGWEHVVREYFLPGLHRAVNGR